MSSYLNTLINHSLKMIDQNSCDLEKLSKGELDLYSLKDQPKLSEIISYALLKTYTSSGNKKLMKVIDLTHKAAQNDPEFYEKYSNCMDILRALRDNNRESKNSKELDLLLRDEIAFLLYLPGESIPALETNAKEAADTYIEKLSKETIFEQLFGLSLASTLSIDSSKSVLRGAGNPLFASFYEMKFLDNFLKKTSLPSEEERLVKTYLKDLKRSYLLNQMIYHLDGREISSAYWACADKMLQETIQLKEGESLHLDIGMSYHAMRLQIQRLQDHFQLTLFDTSGELEFANQRDFKTIKNLMFAHKGPTALSYQVTEEKLQKEGASYFRHLLEYNSKEFSEKSNQSIFEKIDFFKSFKSLGESFVLSNRLTTQKASNCATQRIRADQKKNFGPKLYQKFRKFTIETIKEEYEKMALESDLDKEEIEKLRDLEIKGLSKKEIKKAKKFFTNLNHVPNSLSEWSYVFRMLNHNIARYSRSV